MHAHALMDLSVDEEDPTPCRDQRLRVREVHDEKTATVAVPPHLLAKIREEAEAEGKLLVTKTPGGRHVLTHAMRAAVAGPIPSLTKAEDEESTPEIGSRLESTVVMKHTAALRLADAPEGVVRTDVPPYVASPPVGGAVGPQAIAIVAQPAPSDPPPSLLVPIAWDSEPVIDEDTPTSRWRTRTYAAVALGISMAATIVGGVGYMLATGYLTLP